MVPSDYGSYLPHVIVSQTGMSMAFSHGQPSTIRCVLRVLGGRPDVKMGWIYAARVVAMVAGKHALRNWPSVILKGKNVGTVALSVMIDYAITVALDRSLPFPTPSPTGKKRFELLFQRRALLSIHCRHSSARARH